MNAQPEVDHDNMPAYVMLDGPYPESDQYGDERPVWFVTLYSDDDCELVGKEATSLAGAWATAEQWRDRYGIELVAEGVRC